MFRNLLLAAAILFCVGSLAYVGWQIKLTNDSGSYWGESAQADNLWLPPGNSHVELIQRQETFSGLITNVLFVDDAYTFAKVDMVFEDPNSSNPSNPPAITFSIPDTVNADNLTKLTASSASTFATQKLTKLDMRNEIATNRKDTFVAELVTSQLDKTNFDFTNSLSFIHVAN